MPALRKADWVIWISDWIAGKPVGKISGKLSFAPAAMPAPHSSAAVPALAQGAAPELGTFQPCEVNRRFAPLGLYGYWLVAPSVLRKSVLGVVGTGPYVGVP